MITIISNQQTHSKDPKTTRKSVLLAMDSQHGLPDYDQMPNAPGTEFGGCAWGIFDQNGVRDQLGTLNLLTPSRVLKAAKEEIQCGESVSLNLGLETIQYPAFGRQAFRHKVIDLVELGFAGFDEEITLNPQVTSHWNSFLHFAHQPYASCHENHHDCGPADNNTVRKYIIMVWNMTASQAKQTFEMESIMRVIRAFLVGVSFWIGTSGRLIKAGVFDRTRELRYHRQNWRKWP